MNSLLLASLMVTGMTTTASAMSQTDLYAAMKTASMTKQEGDVKIFCEGSSEFAQIKRSQELPAQEYAETMDHSGQYCQGKQNDCVDAKCFNMSVNSGICNHVIHPGGNKGGSLANYYKTRCAPANSQHAGLLYIYQQYAQPGCKGQYGCIFAMPPNRCFNISDFDGYNWRPFDQFLLKFPPGCPKGTPAPSAAL